MQRNIKYQVDYDLNQSTLGSSSTINQSITEARGRKYCSSGKQEKYADRSSIILFRCTIGTVNKRENCNRISKFSGIKAL